MERRAGSFAVFGLLALLAACAPGTAPTPPGPAIPAVEDDTCGAAPYARLIGQDATALERELIMRQVRVIRPGMVVTMDFSAQRINFEIDDNNRIARIYCG
ncbi:I78 family peptidase inhibitor [Flavimaricola marinus]|uniref:Peptidase inhibitor I78 family protein n=1 Tax=Flavimaricola marinus TaxID=1819565 RepID=A0A238LG03_9RHOB|nr:I78 family peptidase inhibitor [Flavimaricola marinus]SMY08345.1 Peptidase inhibitor I78 family protein [Flavimaricola marinus]